MEANHPHDPAVIDDGRLKAVVPRQLLTRNPNEGQSVIKRLPRRPRHPARQMITVDLDDRVQLLRMGLVEQTQPLPFRHLGLQAPWTISCIQAGPALTLDRMDDDGVAEQHVIAGGLKAKPLRDPYRARVLRVDHGGDVGDGQRRESPVHAGPDSLGRVPVSPCVTTQQPSCLGLLELWPVPQTDPTEQSAGQPIENCQQTMTARAPFLFVGLQSLLCLRAVKHPHEPDNLGIAMQRHELIEVGHPKLTQPQPFGFD